MATLTLGSDASCAGINLSKAGINKNLSLESDAGKIGSLNIEFYTVLFPRFPCEFAGHEAAREGREAGGGKGDAALTRHSAGRFLETKTMTRRWQERAQPSRRS